MWNLKKLVTGLALVVSALATLGPARADCPDQSAHEVSGGRMNRRPWSFCPITLTIGDGPTHALHIPCPASRVTIPAFGLCEPSPGSGTYCRFVANLPVEQVLCQCSPALPFTPFLQVSTCDCGPPMTISWVQDFDTSTC